jgi:hypothetical protein
LELSLGNRLIGGAPDQNDQAFEGSKISGAMKKRCSIVIGNCRSPGTIQKSLQKVGTTQPCRYCILIVFMFYSISQMQSQSNFHHMIKPSDCSMYVQQLSLARFRSLEVLLILRTMIVISGHRPHNFVTYKSNPYKL